MDLDAPAARAPAAAEDEGSGLQLRDMLQKWDYFRKVPRDLTESTEQGASISAAGAWFLILLFLLEFNAYLTVKSVTTFTVDQAADEDLQINFEVQMLRLPCRC